MCVSIFLHFLEGILELIAVSFLGMWGLSVEGFFLFFLLLSSPPPSLFYFLLPFLELALILIRSRFFLIGFWL